MMKYINLFKASIIIILDSNFKFEFSNFDIRISINMSQKTEK